MKKSLLLSCLLVLVFQLFGQNNIRYSSDSTRIKYAVLDRDSTRGKAPETVLRELLHLDNANSFVGMDTTYNTVWNDKNS